MTSYNRRDPSFSSSCTGFVNLFSSVIKDRINVYRSYHQLVIGSIQNSVSKTFMLTSLQPVLKYEFALWYTVAVSEIDDVTAVDIDRKNRLKMRISDNI